MGGCGCPQVCAGLSGCTLHSLDLSDNALGEKGVRAVAGALQSQPAVKSLAFQNDGISVHAARALLEILPAPHNLHKLHFYNNMSGARYHHLRPIPPPPEPGSAIGVWP